MAQYEGQDQFPSSFELVNDGTGRDAASVDVGLEALADRTVYLRNVGFRRLVQWVYDNEAIVPFWRFNSTTYAPNVTDSSAWVVNVSNCRVGDILNLEATFGFAVPASTNAYFRFGVTNNVGTGTEALATNFVLVGNGAVFPITLVTTYTVTAAGTTRVRMLGRYSGTGPEIFLSAHGLLRATLYRPSGSSA